jgi:hypothetical protein
MNRTRIMFLCPAGSDSLQKSGLERPLADWRLTLPKE